MNQSFLYPVDNKDTHVLSSAFRHRLTDFTGNLIQETIATDICGQTTISRTYLDRASQPMTYRRDSFSCSSSSELVMSMMKCFICFAVLMFSSASCVHSADKNEFKSLVAASFRLAGTSQSIDLTSVELSEFRKLCSRMSAVQNRRINGVPVPHDYIYILWTESKDGARTRFGKSVHTFGHIDQLES